MLNASKSTGVMAVCVTCFCGEKHSVLLPVLICGIDSRDSLYFSCRFALLVGGFYWKDPFIRVR